MLTVLALLFALCIGIWLKVFDADFITFTYDLHRGIMKTNKIANKTVWIVGSSSGIGEYLVYELVQSGCKKLILSSRREKQLQRVKTKAIKLAKDIHIVIKPLDLLHFATKDGYNDKFVKSLIESVSFDRIDILVVNSGIIQMGYGYDNDINVLQRVLQINSIGPIALIQSMIRMWQTTDPKHDYDYQIALTSSIAGILGSPQQSAYAMSKFAVNGYLETLRMELMDDNIDINIINPGPVEVNQYSLDITGSSLQKQQIRRSIGQNEGRMKLKRCGVLYTTVLEYSITQAIISTHPVLLLTYIKQYLPSLWYPLSKIIVPMYDPHYKKQN